MTDPIQVPNFEFPGMVDPRTGAFSVPLQDFFREVATRLGLFDTAITETTTAVEAIASGGSEASGEDLLAAMYGTNGVTVYGSIESGVEIRGPEDGEPKFDVLALSSPTTADAGIVLAKRAAEHRFAFQADCPNYDVPLFCKAVMPATGTAYSVVMAVEAACDGSEVLSGQSQIYTIEASVDAAGAFVSGAVRGLAGVYDPNWVETTLTANIEDDGLGNVVLAVYIGRGDPEHTKVHGSMRLATDAPDAVEFTIYPGGLFLFTILTAALPYTRHFLVANDVIYPGIVDGDTAHAPSGDVVYDALALKADKSGNLSQFAATTSAQLAGVISDETGSGALVFGTAPTLSNPIVGTQSPGDNSTKAASTAYADAAAAAASGAAVVDSIADADTTHAPSRNAVFDALALKLDVTAAAAAYQPLDADLTAIAALTTTTTGRSLLTGATEAALRDLLKIGPRYCYEALCDFGTAASIANASAFGTEWTARFSGTGATLTALSGLTSGNSAGRGRSALGTTTTGRVAVATANDAHALGAGAVQFVLKGALESLSDGTDTYVQRIGIIDDHTAEPANGCYFRYTHSVNSGKWECVTRKAGVETATDSGVTVVAGTEFVGQVLVNAAGTSVDFVIDGVTVRTHVANIPTARIGFGAAAIRSAGTASKFALGMDLIYARIDFTTPRW